MVAQTDPSIWVNPTTWYGLGIMGMAFPDWEVWTHTGGSRGSRSTFLRVSNGCSWALLLNGEGSVGGDTFRGALAQALTAVCMSRRRWPDVDLFPQYLPPHVRTRRPGGARRAGFIGYPVGQRTRARGLRTVVAAPA